MELSGSDLQWAKNFFRNIELFQKLSDAELSELLAGLEKNVYPAGTTIIFQNELSSQLYVIESGEVSVWVKKGNQKIKIATLSANDYFGEISLLTPRAATATVKAETDTEVILLPGNVVQQLIKKNQEFGKILAMEIVARLNKQKNLEPPSGENR